MSWTLRRPLVCERCRRTLKRGRGDFYVVRLDAVCDPSPPVFSEEDLSKDLDREIARLSAAMEDRSEQDLVDQVFRRRLLSAKPVGITVQPTAIGFYQVLVTSLLA